MSNEKGVPVMTEQFIKDNIRNLIISTGNAELIITQLFKSKDKHIKQIANDLHLQVMKQGGF